MGEGREKRPDKAQTQSREKAGRGLCYYRKEATQNRGDSKGEGREGEERERRKEERKRTDRRRNPAPGQIVGMPLCKKGGLNSTKCINFTNKRVLCDPQGVHGGMGWACV